MRNKKMLAIASIFVFVTFIVTPILAFAQREVFPLQETDLSVGGSAAGIYVGIENDLFILDRTDELWMVDPLTWGYDMYTGISGVDLIDIVQTPAGEIWWTAPDTTFGNLTLGTGAIETWVLPYEDLNLSSVVYNDGLLWLAPWYGPSHGLFSFDDLALELCLFESPIFASDMVLHGGLLWVIDWSKDQLMSMDPVTGQLVMYSDSDWDIHTYNANLQSDGTLLWWTEDYENGKIVSFDPVTFEATTYQLPSGEQPRNLTLRDGDIWYTNANGSVGRITARFVNKVTETLSEVVLEQTITPVCSTLPSPAASASVPVPGTLVWVDVVENMDQLFGLQTYNLPIGAEPFGIAGTTGEILVSDPGLQKLYRMEALEDLGGGYHTFLPLVIR